MATIVDPSTQCTWVDGQVMAWDPSHIASTARAMATRRAPIGRMIELHLPTGRVDVACRPLGHTALATLAHTSSSEVSPSAAWFGAVHALAEALVRRRRVVPTLTPVEGGAAPRHGAAWWLAGWRPLDADVEAGRTVLAAMPPVVTAATPTTGDEILGTLVDRRCRVALHDWRPALSEVRSAHVRALRLVGRALTSDSGLVVVPPELATLVDELALEFGLVARRAGGEPVVGVRLRLDTPPDDDIGWPLTVELVDLDDRGRWCTEEDVVERRPATRLVSRDDRFTPLLERTLTDGLATITAIVPALADRHARHASGVDVECAASILESVEPLRAAGIELLAPQRLVGRKPNLRATVQPVADPDRPTRFSATALVEWQAVVDGQPVPDEVLARAAEGGAALVEIGGRWIQVDRAEARRALATLAEHRTDPTTITALDLVKLSGAIARAARSGTPTERRASSGDVADASGGASAPAVDVHAVGWAAELLMSRPETTITEGEVPDGFVATLRPYQRRGLGWLQFLRRLGLGGCLADDMGLGKTPTTLAHLAALDGPHLVVCPLSVVRNWEAEAARFTPLLRALVHHGASRTTGEAFATAVASHDLVVTTYQVATRDIDAIRAIDWSTLVLDEAQMVKNPDTATARAMRTITARQRLALTGTPVENRLRELWSIMNIVVPGLLGNATSFRDNFATPIERHHDEHATAGLRALTAPFLLRRTKADRSLVPDLPDKVEQIAWATLTREQAHMYQAVVDRLLVDATEATGMRRRGLVLAALTRLKQICNHPAHALGDGSRLAGRSGKLHRFDELVVDLLDAGERALVFTQFREMGVLLQQHLVERFSLRAPFLHGGVTRPARDRMVGDFQTDPAASPLLIVSLRAGGTGLNLTAASRVVHYDRWWNPAVEDQATDRAWRIGQHQAVLVHKLVCEGTVEERIDTLITDKRALADAVVGGEKWLGELSTDELRTLVTLDRGRHP